MKFTWFNLMPWPYLPADFREKNRSVWVDIDSRLFDPERANEMYHTYMDQLEFAEAVGFDGIGVNEQHQNGYGMMPSPNLIASALARRTSRAATCVLGNSIALYNPPIRVAEELAMLDVISGGRLIAGFPTGTSMDTNFCYGQAPALLRDKYADAHDLILKAWTTPEPFAFAGKYTQLRWVNCWPRPIQASASADLRPRRRLGRDVGLLRRPRVQLLVPVIRGVPSGQGAPRRFLGTGGRHGGRRLASPGGVRADDLRGRHRRPAAITRYPKRRSTRSRSAWPPNWVRRASGSTPSPGLIDTAATRAVVPPKLLDTMVRRTPLARIGQVPEVVAACLFLLSDDAAFMTGQIVAVDGGSIIRL